MTPAASPIGAKWSANRVTTIVSAIGAVLALSFWVSSYRFTSNISVSLLRFSFSSETGQAELAWTGPRPILRGPLTLEVVGFVFSSSGRLRVVVPYWALTCVFAILPLKERLGRLATDWRASRRRDAPRLSGVRLSGLKRHFPRPAAISAALMLAMCVWRGPGSIYPRRLLIGPSPVRWCVGTQRGALLIEWASRGSGPDRTRGYDLHFVNYDAVSSVTNNGAGPTLTIHNLWLSADTLLPALAILPLRRIFLERRKQWRRRRPQVCASCGYDLRGSSGATCPECGAERPDVVVVPNPGVA